MELGTRFVQGRDTDANVEAPTSERGLEDLPDEMICAVFCALRSASDACRLAAVSRTFYRIAHDDALWRGLFRALPGPSIDEGLLRHLGHDWLWLYCARATPVHRRTTGVGTIGGADLPYVYMGQVARGVPRGMGIGWTTEDTDPERQMVECDLADALGSLFPRQQLKRGAWFCGRWVDGRPSDGRCAFGGDAVEFAGEFRLGPAEDGDESVVPLYKGTITYLRSLTVERYEGQAIYRNLKLQRHGHGTAYYRKGTRYEGRWRENKRHGWGVSFRTDGSIREGDRYRGDKHGRVVEMIPEGRCFDVTYEHGVPRGAGTLVWHDGRRFAGVWSDGSRACGVMTWPDGSRYDGNLRRLRRDGYGAMNDSLGNRYEGTWRADAYHGQGTMHYANGDAYDGGWKWGYASGRGTRRYANGDRYEGEWKCGVQRGEGTMHYANGNRYEGEWRYDRPDGSGTMYYANGDRYDGPWERGRRKGSGVMHHANGDRYEGSWERDRKKGYGVMHYANGDRYEGEWEHDDRHGSGVLVRPDGSRSEGCSWSWLSTSGLVLGFVATIVYAVAFHIAPFVAAIDR